jgi:O-antigen/teichoic acid export membrane protein
VINLLLNLYLIPRYGANGAAIASLITHTALFIIYFYYSFKTTGSSFVDAKWIINLLLIVIMVLVCLGLKAVSTGLSLSIFPFLAAAFFMFTLSKDEKIFFTQLVRKRVRLGRAHE